METEREKVLNDLLQIKTREYDIVRGKYLALKEQFEKEWVTGIAKDQRIDELKRAMFKNRELCYECKNKIDKIYLRLDFLESFFLGFFSSLSKSL